MGVIGQISFWLTVALATAGSVLSAFCIHAPASDPRQDPYFFLGQWFIWLATPLLWGLVAASQAFAWLRPVDLAGVLAAAALARWSAHAVCNLKWRRGGSAGALARARHRTRLEY